MQLEMKDPESIHSPNTEAVIGNYRWDGDLKTKFQAKENMTLISRVKKTKNKTPHCLFEGAWIFSET